LGAGVGTHGWGWEIEGGLMEGAWAERGRAQDHACVCVRVHVCVRVCVCKGL